MCPPVYKNGVKMLMVYEPAWREGPQLSSQFLRQGTQMQLPRGGEWAWWGLGKLEVARHSHCVGTQSAYFAVSALTLHKELMW